MGGQRDKCPEAEAPLARSRDIKEAHKQEGKVGSDEMGNVVGAKSLQSLPDGCEDSGSHTE